MISTRDLSSLPDVEGTRRLMQTLALLDAILCPEWEFRYFSFNDDWEPGEKLGLMRNGEGDDWLLFFNMYGAVLKGFKHDCKMAQWSPWPGLFDGLPESFGKFLAEPAFSMDKSTFCIWRLVDEDAWQRGDIDFPAGNDPDGSAELMRFLDGDPKTYKKWGDDYFGVPLDVGVLQRIYDHEPLVPSLVRALNPDSLLPDVRSEAREIGYPVG